MHRLPTPSAYLDPLYSLETCYFYAIPKFYPLDHPNTRWLLSMIRTQDVDRIRRKMELQPDAFRTSYFQLLDCPRIYNNADPAAPSLFHKQAVIYLTMLGVAFYLKSIDVVKMALAYRDPIGDALYTLKDPQYATHVQDTVLGDFHAYPLSVIMLRSGCYDYVLDMLVEKWNPLEPICMPARRRYERRAYYFLDWLDYCLWLMHVRPLLPLARLVQNLTIDQALYKFQRMPISAINTKSEKDRIYTGLIDVDNLPREAKMIGTKSLLEIAEDYSSYQQTKDRYKEVCNCIRQMVADGYNPQIVMAQAQDFDAGDEPENAGANANNNAAPAAAAKKNKFKVTAQGPYASEATRVLLHALKTGAKPANKTPLHPLLDVVEVYIKRKLFLIEPTSKRKKGKGEKVPADVLKAQQQLAQMQRRDARNAIVILLNLLQQQFDNIDRMNRQQKEKKSQKHKHIDPTRQASNKRLILAKNLKRLVGLLFNVLLHSRQLISFVQAQFPPYKFANGEIDFELNPSLQNNLSDVQMGVIIELNQSAQAPSYMTIGEMQRAAEVKTIFLNLRLGKPPPNDPLGPLKHNKNSDGRQNEKNVSNINASSDACPQNQPLTASDSLYMLANDAVSPQLCETSKHGHVSFIRVKKRRRSLSKAKETDDEKISEPESTETDAIIKSEDPTELAPLAAEGAAPEPAVNDDIAQRLTEQIAQLRQRSFLENNAADAALADIYCRILEDLKSRAAAAVGAAGPSTEKVALETLEEHEELSKSSKVIPNNQQQTQEATTTTKATKRSTSRRRSAGRPVGKRRLSTTQNPGGVRRPKCYQMVRVFDAPLEGTEFS